MRRVRLRKISYIPQGAMNSLNPVMRIENQIWDGILAHEGAVTHGGASTPVERGAGGRRASIRKSSGGFTRTSCRAA
jgi:ABC-type dipeptide/oligopeptide/nickel transport system ATPase component